MSLLEVKNLVKHYESGAGLFRTKTAIVKAVDDVSFQINSGEAFGLVGESGSGKTSIGRCILRLIQPTSGIILFDGRNLVPLTQNEMRPVRRQMQVIFQDPYASLNPRMTAGQIIEEPLLIHQMGTRAVRLDRVQELMQRVGLDPEMIHRYPDEFSGGQRQRIGIARAIALSPRLIVADEPVSDLDASIQAQIINLLKDLQESYQLAFLFIAHDLALVHHFCDRIGVLYLGKMVEIAPRTELFQKPLHPYTKLLIDSIPVPDPAARRKRRIPSGEIAGALKIPPGCKFHPRCPIAVERCRTEEPKLREFPSGRQVACHFAENGF